MQKEIKDVLNELNKSTEGSPWICPGGTHALTKVEKKDDNFTFKPDSGIIVKVFFNQISGEIRLYPAMMFRDAF